MVMVGKDSSKLVGDTDYDEVIKVASGTTVDDACRQMSERDIASVIVVDDSQFTTQGMPKEEVKGILTVRDVVNRVIGKGKDPSKVKVDEVMSPQVLTITSDTSVYRTCFLMNQNNYRQVPIMDGNSVSGMVTAHIINMELIKTIINDINMMVAVFK